MARLNKNKDGTGKVNWEGNLSGRPVPRKAGAGLDNRSSTTNSLPQPGPSESPLAGGASPRRSLRKIPGPSLPPVA